jgi:hypothetical protein
MYMSAHERLTKDDISCIVNKAKARPTPYPTPGGRIIYAYLATSKLSQRSMPHMPACALVGHVPRASRGEPRQERPRDERGERGSHGGDAPQKPRKPDAAPVRGVDGTRERAVLLARVRRQLAKCQWPLLWWIAFIQRALEMRSHRRRLKF